MVSHDNGFSDGLAPDIKLSAFSVDGKEIPVFGDPGLDAKPMYKFFNEEKYAKGLAEGGIIKLSTLDECRRMEGVGNDTGEGKSTYKEPDRIEKREKGFLVTSRIERNYVIKDAVIFCASLKQDLSRFGPYRVEISQPVKFIQCVTRCLHREHPVSAVYFKKVLYGAERSHVEGPSHGFVNVGTSGTGCIINCTFNRIATESMVTLPNAPGPVIFLKTEPDKIEEEVRVFWQRTQPIAPISTPLILTCPALVDTCSIKR